MKNTRNYTGEDNRSHFEDLDIPLHPIDFGCMSDRLPAASVVFRETPDGCLDFHPAPRRQFVLTIIGEVELECGDETKKRLRAGDILLADDTTGQGDISHDIQGPRRSVVITVPDTLDIDACRKTQ